MGEEKKKDQGKEPETPQEKGDQEGSGKGEEKGVGITLMQFEPPLPRQKPSDQKVEIRKEGDQGCPEEVVESAPPFMAGGQPDSGDRVSQRAHFFSQNRRKLWTLESWKRSLTILRARSLTVASSS